MIVDLGISGVLLAVALFIVCQIDPTMQLLHAIKHHRQAQGDSVLNHAGLLESETDEADA